jgi:hypothetical protein
MTKTVDFVVIIEDGLRKRHYHETEGGKVKDFVVQLEVRVKEEWKVVVRYDCSHRFSHIDRYTLKGEQTKEALNLSFESALTYADWDINRNWSQYKMEFLKGASNE